MPESGFAIDGGTLASPLAHRPFSRPLARRLHRALLRTTDGPLRPLWRLAYAGAVRACGAYLSAGASGASIYVGGSLARGRPVYGLADLDLTVVVPGDGEAGRVSARVRARWDRLTRAVPLMAELVDCCVYDEVHLRAAVRDSTITYALGAPGPGRDSAGRAVYQGPPVDEDLMRLLERPELYGPAAWRRVAGPDRRPRDLTRDAQRRRIVAWLELQFLWRLAVELCLDPGRPGAASMCVKLVAEPARMWMWLAGGPWTGGRAETLTEALVRIPDEAPALERALALQRELRSAPPPPLTDALPAFLRLSSRIARTIADQLESAGATDVALVRGEELALPHGGWEPTGPWPFPPPSRLLPLADWRAIVDPALPDETFAPVAGDATDPETLSRAALVLTKGPYPTLTADGLLLRPYHGGRARLRAVQCPMTDPVSFALMDGEATAAFPNATGWSARDTARRGRAEHAAWLAAHPMPAEPSGHHLGRLITAARAALFLESVEEGAPRLALTGAATARALAERVEGARGVAEAAWDAYMTFAVDWLAPDPATVGALDDLVRGLSPYAR